MNNKIQELQDKIKKFQEQIKEEGKLLFKDFSTEIFEKYPVIESFSWTQYTPHFCDGDPCRFRVNDYSLEINEADSYDNKIVPQEAFKEIGKILNTIDQTIMESMFGDGVRVIVKKDGITIDEYEHD